MGLISALFVIVLSLSGLILHHANRLNLDTRFLQSPALLAWYSIEVPSLRASFTSGTREVSQIETAIYVDAHRLPATLSTLVGAVPVSFGHVIAGSGQLLLINTDGELIEVLGSQHDVPPVITGIGSTADGTIYLRGVNTLFHADLDSLQFTALDTPTALVLWSESGRSTLAQQIRVDYGRTLLTWERVLLDVHSGRFFGGFGVLLVDVMAILFVFMALTGIWIWARRRNKNSQ